jgi:hypothetical protein
VRCERMKSTFTTATCLRKQAEMERYVKTRKRTSNGLMIDVPNSPAHVCYKCAQGAEIKRSGGDDMDVEELKEMISGGLVPTIMRTCSNCRIEKEVSQFLGSSAVCRKCKISITRARMKEANKSVPGPGPSPPDSVLVATKRVPPEATFAIEAGGLRIQVCQNCLKRFLGV